MATTATGSKVVRFSKTRNNGTAKCESCGKNTWKDRIDGSTGLCETCYEEAGLENEHEDGYHLTENGVTIGARDERCPMCKAHDLAERAAAQAEEETMAEATSGYEVVRNDGVVVGTYDNGSNTLAKLAMLQASDDEAIYTVQETTMARKTATVEVSDDAAVVTVSKAQARKEIQAEAKAAREAKATATKAERDAAKAAKTALAAEAKAAKAPKREPIVQTFPGRPDAFITRRNQVEGHACGLCSAPITVGESYERLQKASNASAVAGFTLPKGQVHFHTVCVTDVERGTAQAAAIEAAKPVKATKESKVAPVVVEKVIKAKAPRKPKATTNGSSGLPIPAEVEEILGELVGEPVE